MMWGSFCSSCCCSLPSSLSRLPSASAHTKHHHKSTRQQPIVKRGRTRRSREIKNMRAVVQRVASASVEVEGRMISEIGPGLLVLVGLHDSDVDSDADYICRKVLNMRLFPNDKTGKAWDQNVMQRNLEVLLVSQFTLYGVLKGNKPDFHVAMPPERAKPFYASVVEKFRKSYAPHAIKGTSLRDKAMFDSDSILSCTNGVFGAMMKVNLVNDGPVTMQLDSSLPSKSKSGSAEGEEEPK